MGRKPGTPKPPKPDHIEPRPRQKGQSANGRSARDQALRRLMHEIPEGNALSDLIFGFVKPRMTPRLPHPAEDRHAAVACAAALELALKRNIAGHLAPGANLAAVFEQYPGAPLSSFADRTIMAEALGIISAQEAADLGVIRRVRNVFAHTVHPLTFAQEEIGALVAEMKELKQPLWEVFDRQFTEPRDRYVITCAIHYTALERYKPPGRVKPPVNLFAEAIRSLPPKSSAQRSPGNIFESHSPSDTPPPPESSLG